MCITKMRTEKLEKHNILQLKEMKLNAKLFLAIQIYVLLYGNNIDRNK